MKIPTETKEAKEVVSKRLLNRRTTSLQTIAGPRMLVSDSIERSKRNVHGVGVGRKVVSGKNTSTPCVRLYVHEKLPDNLISHRYRLPSEIDGIPTDVIESPAPFFSCTNLRQLRQRPIRAGISAASPLVRAGTIGAFCRSVRSGDDPNATFALSNNHVFANINNPGGDLYQPSSEDAGSLIDLFATLDRFVPLRPGGYRNSVDAAIGRVLSGVEIDPMICGIGRISSVARATVGLRVCKHGRTSGYSEGVVTDESADEQIAYYAGGTTVTFLFSDQVRIEPTGPFTVFGSPGDSGALICNLAKSRAVGLYFASPNGGSFGLANHLATVLAQLQIALV